MSASKLDFNSIMKCILFLDLKSFSYSTPALHTSVQFISFVKMANQRNTRKSSKKSTHVGNV